MYKTKDGKRYENIEIGRAHDRSRGHEPKAEKKPKAKPESGGDKEESIEDVVKAHGPAHETHIEKSGDGEEYSVHSTHEDGHKHSSHGHSVHEAHQYSLIAHGAAPDDEEAEEEAEGEEPMAAHSSPPGMPAMG